MKLTDLPHDILYLIIIRIHQNGSSLRPFAETCQSLYNVYHTLHLGGVYALPITLRAPRKSPNGLSVSTSEDGILNVCKTRLPGDAHMVFEHDVSQTSTFWEVRLDEFRGHRVEIGVAKPGAFRFGMVERASSWSFDCFGRACIAGYRRTYGRHMCTGDVIGVVYDAARGVLAFLDRGVSMGALVIRRYRSTPHSPLYPFIYFPCFQGESVSILRPPMSVIDLARIHDSARLWSRPKGLAYDGHIIVSSWEELVWYAIPADTNSMTLAQLWKELEKQYGMPMHLFELIFNGRRLPNRADLKLCDVGIRIDERTGSCRSDILLSVPHIIS